MGQPDSTDVRNNDLMIIDSHIEPCAVPRALLVDDEPTILRILSLFLTQIGFEVECANNGAEAITRFVRGGWDVVLTDLMMPGMAGDQLAAALRKIDPSVPIILVSGHAHVMDHAFPFDALVAKPFTAKSLTTAIREAMVRVA